MTYLADLNFIAALQTLKKKFAFGILIISIVTVLIELLHIRKVIK